MGFLSEWEAKKGEWEPKLKKIQQLAKEKLNCSLAQLSIAWVVKNKDIWYLIRNSCIKSIYCN